MGSYMGWHPLRSRSVTTVITSPSLDQQVFECPDRGQGVRLRVRSTLYRSEMHFEKHLVRVGNSLGIVLDQPVLRAMGLGRKTRVRVRTDGYLIVIEPAQKPAFEAGRVSREIHSIRLACALDTARALGDSLSPDQMAELGAGRVLLSSYSMMLARKTSFDARWLVLIERLDHVRQAIDAGRNSVEAIAAALEAVPGGPYEGRLS